MADTREKDNIDRERLSRWRGVRSGGAQWTRGILPDVEELFGMSPGMDNYWMTDTGLRRF